MPFVTRPSVMLASLFVVAACSNDARLTSGPPELPVIGDAPIVAELFTSQSCSSCPPAEAYFAELSQDENLIVLEWHVDYWDKLVHGGDGAWKDPYSVAAYTHRQVLYNQSLRGRGDVYTPQAIINGRSEGVGSRRSEIKPLLARGPASIIPAKIAVSDNSNWTLELEKTAPFETPVSIHLVRLLEEQTTAVKAGENKGRQLGSRHIVLSTSVIGAYDGQSTSIEIPPAADGETCAVLIQSMTKNQIGPVLGAAACPS